MECQIEWGGEHVRLAWTLDLWHHLTFLVHWQIVLAHLWIYTTSLNLNTALKAFNLFDVISGCLALADGLVT